MFRFLSFSSRFVVMCILWYWDMFPPFLVFRMMLAPGLPCHMCPLWYWDMFPPFLVFSIVFVMKECWICQRPFLHLLKQSCDLCPWVCLCNVLCLLKTFLSLWNEINYLDYDDHFDVFLNLVFKYFEKLYLWPLGRLACNFLFSLFFFSDFDVIS